MEKKEERVGSIVPVPSRARHRKVITTGVFSPELTRKLSVFAKGNGHCPFPGAIMFASKLRRGHIRLWIKLEELTPDKCRHSY
jgi:hypothetical protein